MNPQSGLRKKQPARVRRALLDQGARLCSEHGVPGLTLQAVADAAGVTKGGLLHHFPSKQALVEAIFDDLLQRFEHSIDRLMALDAESHGRFTRAYVIATMELIGMDEFIKWQSLMMTMLTDPGIRQGWKRWMEAQQARYRESDEDGRLVLARYAADGIWLAAVQGHSILESGGQRDELLAHLIGMTRSP